MMVFGSCCFLFDLPVTGSSSKGLGIAVNATPLLACLHQYGRRALHIIAFFF